MGVNLVARYGGYGDIADQWRDVSSYLGRIKWF
jgi:hypothetical protein